MLWWLDLLLWWLEFFREVAVLMDEMTIKDNTKFIVMLHFFGICFLFTTMLVATVLSYEGWVI